MPPSTQIGCGAGWIARWPWITVVLGLALMVSPAGQEVLLGAFFSGEQLTQHLSLFLLSVLASIVTGAALLEWLARFLWLRHRAKRRVEAILAEPIGGKTET